MKRPCRSNFQGRSRRRGGVLVLVAICLVAIMSVAALSLDGGRMLTERRQVQAAADAAADAAALEAYSALSAEDQSTTDALIRAKALEIAAANGYANDGVHSIVQINAPPKSGQYVGRRGFVEVEVESRLARSFSGILASGRMTVRGRAVAAGTEVATRGTILVLEPKKKHAAKLSGKSASMELAGDLIINSKNKKAFKLDRKFQVKADHILVAGDVERKVKDAAGRLLKTGVNPTPDPLAGLELPRKGTVLNPDSFKSGPKDQETFRLKPGTYDKLKFDKNQKVYLESGVYNVQDEFSVKGNATLQGDGVTIYMASKKELKLHTKAGFQLTPPTEGPYQGISILLNPEAKSKLTFRKDANFDLSGLIYAPNARVSFKQIDGTIGGYKGEDDEFYDEDLEDDSDDGSPMTNGSLNAAIIAREFRVDKKTHLRINGVDIHAKRPLLGLVE